MKDLEIRKQAKMVAARFGRTYDEKQDIEGRCLEAAWKALPKVTEGIDPKNYLIRTMENTAISYRRSVKVADSELPLTEEANEIFSDNQFEDMVVTLELEEKTAALISQLKYPDNKIVEMLVAGADIADIASSLKMTVGAVLTRISRGRKKWKEVFELV